LRRLLEELADPASFVDTEVSFRPLPEFELWVADVAYLSAERFAGVDPEDNVRGAPNLVIEVLSPSNTVDEMNERERICLENGAQEFWVVDPKRRQVKISTPDGHTTTWRSVKWAPELRQAVKSVVTVDPKPENETGGKWRVGAKCGPLDE